MNDVEGLDDQAVRALAQRYATIVDELELEAGEPLLVLPTAEFFPDRFTGDEASVGLLAARIQGYAGLEDVRVDTRLSGAAATKSDGGSCGTGGCGTGACATGPESDVAEPRLLRAEGGYVLNVPGAELGHSIVLTARLATAFGAVALAERRDPGDAGEAGDAELAATALGFGVLLLEASYLYSKSCGGPSVQRATSLGLDELSLLFALSVAREGHPLRAALAELGTTQRALVKSAAAVVSESPGLVELLKKNPARAARGDFRLRDGRSLVSRLFQRSRPKSEDERLTDALGALESGASVDEVADLLGATRR
jgi:hypothetical protein